MRVFRSTEASRLGHDVGQQRHTRVVRSEKCVALRDGCGAGMCVIAAFFARVLRMCIGCTGMGFLLVLQEVRRICKTRNQFCMTSLSPNAPGKEPVYSHESSRMTWRALPWLKGQGRKGERHRDTRSRVLARHSSLAACQLGGTVKAHIGFQGRNWPNLA